MTWPHDRAAFSERTINLLLEHLFKSIRVPSQIKHTKSHLGSRHSYMGHTKNPNSSSHQKHQPYVFSGNTGLGSQLAGATGVVGRKGVACNQQLQPTEIPTMYFRRIRRAYVFGWAAWCGPGRTPTPYNSSLACI